MQRAEFQPEDVVEENLAIEIGFGESIGAGVELRLILWGLEAERIEIGVKVSADAVGADQHQRADRVTRRLLHVDGGDFDAFGQRFGFYLVADGPFDLLPIAVERGQQFTPFRTRPTRLLPGSAVRALDDIRAGILQAGEE
jgi:hypothetical protein